MLRNGERVSPASEYATWENIDRVVTLSFRPVGRSRGAMTELYARVRGDRPISYEIARDLLDRRGGRVGVLTGAAVPQFLPKGESDGPLGAFVLASALRTLGYDVTLLAEAELRDIFTALFPLFGAEFPWVVLAHDDPTDHANTAPDLDVLIAVEKLGSNAKHVMHGATGISRNGTRAHVDGLVQRMNAAGKLTVGVGDGGNEIGFGKVYDVARELVDYGKRCRCPCEDGIITVTPTQYLYPVGVSNWGAYGITAALAAMTGELEVLHTPQRERDLLALATRVDCRDGATGTARESVDGIPGDTSAAVVQILKTLVESANEREERPF